MHLCGIQYQSFDQTVLKLAVSEIIVTMHVAGLMGLALGPATCMNHQFTVATQAWGGDAQQPERRPLVQSKYDAFVTLAYNREYSTSHEVCTPHRYACFAVVISCKPVGFFVRRAGLLWSQQDFEWRWSVPLFKCLTVLEFSFILFDLCLLITFFNFIMNYVPIVTFWIFTYHKIWILSIMFCFIWSYWIIYFLACLEVSWRVVS